VGVLVGLECLGGDGQGRVDGERAGDRRPVDDEETIAGVAFSESALQTRTAIIGCSDCLSGLAAWVFDPG
jgi:hypothetical protein